MEPLRTQTVTSASQAHVVPSARGPLFVYVEPHVDELLVKILFALLGLAVGMLTWFLKTGWARTDRNTAEIEKIRLACGDCKNAMHADTSAEIKQLLEQISDMIDAKLEAWWNRIELNLVNDGRVPPKRSKKEN